MKKIAAVFIGSIFLFVIACNNKPEKTINTTTTFKSKNTDSFNIAFDSVLTEYNALKIGSS